MSKDEEVTKLLDKDSLKQYELYNEIILQIQKDGKKDFKLRDGNIIVCGKNFIYQNDKEENKIFIKGSRIFYFINEKETNKNKAFFIHDQGSLEKALKETNITNDILKKKMIMKIQKKIIIPINLENLMIPQIQF